MLQKLGLSTDALDALRGEKLNYKSVAKETVLSPNTCYKLTITIHPVRVFRRLLFWLRDLPNMDVVGNVNRTKKTNLMPTRVKDPKSRRRGSFLSNRLVVKFLALKCFNKILLKSSILQSIHCIDQSLIFLQSHFWVYCRSVKRVERNFVLKCMIYFGVFRCITVLKASCMTTQALQYKTQ